MALFEKQKKDVEWDENATLEATKEMDDISESIDEDMSDDTDDIDEFFKDTEIEELDEETSEEVEPAANEVEDLSEEEPEEIEVPDDLNVDDVFAPPAEEEKPEEPAPDEDTADEEVSEEPTTQSEEVAPPSGEFCPVCGEPLREGSKFCTKCGARVGADSFLNSAATERYQVNVEHLVIPKDITKASETIVRVVDGKCEVIAAGNIPVKVVRCTDEECEIMKLDHTLRTQNLSLKEEVEAYAKEQDHLDAIKALFHVETVADLNGMSHADMEKYMSVKDVDPRLLNMDIDLDTAVELTYLGRTTQKMLADIATDAEVESIGRATVAEIAEIPVPTERDIFRALRRDIRRTTLTFVEDSVNKLIG